MDVTTPIQLTQSLPSLQVTAAAPPVPMVVQFQWHRRENDATYHGLYANHLFIGDLQHFNIAGLSSLCTGGVPEDRKWRAWLMSDEEGIEVGWFNSEGQAKSALLRAAINMLHHL